MFNYLPQKNCSRKKEFSASIWHLLGERGARAGWGCGNLLRRQILEKYFMEGALDRTINTLWELVEGLKNPLRWGTISYLASLGSRP